MWALEGVSRRTLEQGALRGGRVGVAQRAQHSSQPLGCVLPGHIRLCRAPRGWCGVHSMPCPTGSPGAPREDARPSGTRPGGAGGGRWPWAVQPHSSCGSASSRLREPQTTWPGWSPPVLPRGLGGPLLFSQLLASQWLLRPRSGHSARASGLPRVEGAEGAGSLAASLGLELGLMTEAAAALGLALKSLLLGSRLTARLAPSLPAWGWGFPLSLRRRG